MKQKPKNAVSQAEKRLIKEIDKQRALARSRFPLTFALFASFGFVVLLDGFQKIIEQVTFFDNNPLVLIFTGLVILAITGSVYKKLG